MIHCTMDELLALRANEGSVWARQHLDACPVCRAELEALYQRVAQLKALPSLGPARSGWPSVRAGLVAAHARRRRRWAVWGGGLAAAALAAGVVVFHPFGGGRAHADELAQAKQRSASLEAVLQRYHPDSRVVTGRTAALTAELEDRIATVDGELAQLNAAPVPPPAPGLVKLWQDRLDAAPVQSPAPGLVKLWQDRANLMQQLVDVHATRAVYVGL